MSSTQKDSQECRQLKPEGKLLQTNGLAPPPTPTLRNHWLRRVGLAARGATRPYSPRSPKSNLRKTLQCRGRELLVLLCVRNAHRAPFVSTAGCYIGAQPTRAVDLL